MKSNANIYSHGYERFLTLFCLYLYLTRLSYFGRALQCLFVAKSGVLSAKPPKDTSLRLMENQSIKFGKHLYGHALRTDRTIDGAVKVKPVRDVQGRKHVGQLIDGTIAHIPWNRPFLYVLYLDWGGKCKFWISYDRLSLSKICVETNWRLIKNVLCLRLIDAFRQKHGGFFQLDFFRERFNFFSVKTNSQSVVTYFSLIGLTLIGFDLTRVQSCRFARNSH